MSDKKLDWWVIVSASILLVVVLASIAACVLVMRSPPANFSRENYESAFATLALLVPFGGFAVFMLWKMFFPTKNGPIW